ncbi:hypothetical protein [Chitinophaga sp. S165]|uniref:hypothetical protein n=1 Tax=Chitinophaga sp. S165 TaxID=2135462 RepID=UPI000D80F118|nr:hypothetical protein [Chitinophaga sp. S165]PWV47470.1 hypothetical protein C7475_10837 [Chitinophaga sp. S165]
MKNKLIMEDKKVYTSTGTKMPYNLLVKMQEDQNRIMEAIHNGQPLSTLKGIEIVKPL